MTIIADKSRLLDIETTLEIYRESRQCSSLEDWVNEDDIEWMIKKLKKFLKEPENANPKIDLDELW